MLKNHFTFSYYQNFVNFKQNSPCNLKAYITKRRKLNVFRSHVMHLPYFWTCSWQASVQQLVLPASTHCKLSLHPAWFFIFRLMITKDSSSKAEPWWQYIPGLAESRKATMSQMKPSYSDPMNLLSMERTPKYIACIIWGINAFIFFFFCLAV